MFNTILISCLLFSFSSGITQEKDTIASTVDYQKEVIGKLTGKEAIVDKGHLKQRATYNERVLTAEYLANELEASGWSTGFHKYRTPQSTYFLDLFFRPNKGINVIGKVSATVATEKHIILGAHFDSERKTPGAVDNASGVALCLALARELQNFEHREYNITIVFFDQEEDDEVRSEVFVKMIQKTKLDVHSVHIFDLIGWDADGDGALTLQSPAPFLEDLYRKEAKSLKISLKTIGGAGSDNKPFLKAGYPTVHPFEEMDDSTPYIHSPQDTYETVNFNFLEQSTEYITNVISSILQEK